MKPERTDRLNSLLVEVISEVIRKEVRNPHVHVLYTVMSVNISRDLQHATVYVSVMGTDQEKAETIQALQSAAGFIAVQASKKVTMRYFPNLLFKLDNSVDKQIRIHDILTELETERNSRNV
ncbi:MAG: rbfA [Chlamydiales bacterium]|jgi:ribosome-binding factor A|nr:rbfA [Chlamydiales bacterium]